MIKKGYILSLLLSSLVLVGCGGKTAISKMPDNKETPVITEDVQTVFALGDSLTAGYQLPLEESYPAQLESILKENGYDRSASNGGKSGETSSGLVQTVSWITADAKKGDIAVLTIGGNDGLQSLSVEQLESNLREIIDILLAKDLVVVVGGMQLPTNFNPTYREQFSGLYSRVVAQYDEGVSLLPFLLEGVAGDSERNLPDGIHPNKEGYAIVAQTVYDHLLQYGLLDD